MGAYDFPEFLREETGSDVARGELAGKGSSLDYVLGELLVLVSRANPPKEYSFDTALVFVDVANDRVRVSHDVYEGKSFEMSREDFTRAVKDAIASSRGTGVE